MAEQSLFFFFGSLLVLSRTGSAAGSGENFLHPVRTADHDVSFYLQSARERWNVSQISGVYVTRPSGKELTENVWKVEIISNRSRKVTGCTFCLSYSKCTNRIS